MEVLTELQLAASVEHVTDIKEIPPATGSWAPRLWCSTAKLFRWVPVPTRNKLKAMLVKAGAAQGETGK